MAAQRIVVIGTSAGGIDALRKLLAGLPATFPAPIAVVVHISPHSPGVLDEILDRVTSLAVSQPRSGERLRAGRVYIAPPDQHLLIEPGTLRLTRGPRENRFRPAVDPLLRSAAQVYGPAAIGVVLTGNLNDGTAGLRAIKQMGGTAVVQDPDDAAYPSMPRSALRHVKVDYSVPLAEMPALLMRLVSAEVYEPAETAGADRIDVEVRIAREENPLAAGLATLGSPSYFTCPECHGVLFRMDDAAPMRFRCHTGHAFSSDALVASLDETIEEALWNTVRAMEEGALLADHMALHAREHADAEGSRTLSDEAANLRSEMEILRDLLRSRGTVSVEKRKVAG